MRGREHFVLAVVAVLAGGCDGIWDLKHLGPPPVPDGPLPPDGPPPDGPTELGFGAPVLVANLSSSTTDSEPSLPTDMLEIYFKSSRSNGLGMSDIWRATRPTTSDPWTTPMSVAPLSSGDNETSPRISPDGLTIWFQRNNTTSSNTMVSTRGTRTAQWSTPMQLTEFNSMVGDNQFSSTDPAQLVGYLTSEHGTTTRPHLFRTTRTSTTAAWSAPVEIAELMSTTGNNWTPWATPDGLAIIWASNRGGSEGSYDLWLATRATTDAPFGAAINLAEINNEFSQSDPWISPDRRHVFFGGDNGGNLDIYEASR
jgi:hypothetical protein